MNMMKVTETRRRIEAELASVNRIVVALKKEPRPEELESFGDNTPLSEEMDASSSVENKELRADRLGRLLERAAALDEALHRVDDGTYGICVGCDGKIGSERLRAAPEAAYCIRCQEDLEGRPRREEIVGG